MKWEDITKPVRVFGKTQPLFTSIPLASGDTFDRYVPVYNKQKIHTLYDGRLRVLEIRKGHYSDMVQIWLLGGLEPVIKHVDDDLSLSVRKTDIVYV